MGEASQMDLVYSLVGYPSETEWLEFKENNADPERLAEDISALANTAAYYGREMAYKIWGVEDGTHRLLGTMFRPLQAKVKGNQGLLIWLSSVLSLNANYEFEQIEHDAKVFVVLKVRAACGQPVFYNGKAYIREGSSTKLLSAGSAKEAELWRKLQSDDFELRTAEKDVSAHEVFDLLDVDAYFSLLAQRKPQTMETCLQVLCEQDLLHIQDNGYYAITNLGALLVARNIGSFPGLRKRPLRVIRFDGKGSFDILDDRTFVKGYALALQEAEHYIMSVIPSREVVDGAFRRVQPVFPQRAVREFLSNAVIHQDLADVTSGPLVGIYSNRIEFTNPGATLIPCERLLNAQPKTRNNCLVGLLRQMDLCEEGGTGWDLAVAACEAAKLPAPEVETSHELGTKVTVRCGVAYDRMTRTERRDAVYWHACLMYAQGESMSNQTLRDRFGLDDDKKNGVAISRLIRDCCEVNLIKEEDETAGAKYKRYIPAWV